MSHPAGRGVRAACAALAASIIAAWPLAGAAQGSAAQETAGGDAAARVIVKLRADSALLQPSARSARSAAGEWADVRAFRAQALGMRHGLALRAGSAVGERTQVVHATGLSSAQLAEQLARDADVEYAVPDRRRFRAAVPNDPLFPNRLPAPLTPRVGQWTLRAPTTGVRSAIDAVAAWDVTPGNPAVVVAVLDSGVRFDHPDLLPVSKGGNLLPGYDMIANAAVAGDGNGRDADASDEGDYLTEAEIAADPSTFRADECPPQAHSSWHGMQVAGVVGAATDNGIGMAGLGRAVRVLPVRVLGKCGGYDSDIVPAIRWAAGLAVPGVPINPNRARVINLSLGSVEPCSAAYRDAIAEVSARGVLVVVSAGNTSGHAVGAPANCPGAIAVAGLRHVGSKVGFSDLGPEVAISAPAGNCILTGPLDPCLYPILTLTNRGLTAPLSHSAGGSAYTDSFDFSVGTSFSAPLVAGTAALMLSVQPALTPLDVKQIMQTTARAFPQSGSIDPDVQRCTAPQVDASGGRVDQLECYCSTGACGAGMLDAGAAVLAAFTGTPLPRSRARIDIVGPLAVRAGETLRLTGASSEPARDRFITAYRWSIVDSGGIVGAIVDPSGVEVALRPVAAGRLTVRLTVTDSAPLASSTDLTIAVLPAAPAPPPSTGGGGGGAFAPGWLVALALAVAFSSPRRSGARRDRAPRS